MGIEPATLDHLVLTVSDIEATVEFYERVVGATPETFDGGKRRLSVGDRKINLHEASGEYDLQAGDPTPGAGDFCLITETPIEEVTAHLREEGVEVVAGPDERQGTRGSMTSVYFRDPDDNLVEVSKYDD